MAIRRTGLSGPTPWDLVPAPFQQANKNCRAGDATLLATSRSCRECRIVRSYTRSERTEQVSFLTLSPHGNSDYTHRVYR